THSPSTRPDSPSARRASAAASEGPHASQNSSHSFDPGTWQQILGIVRAHHPRLHRVWFDQMTPKQLTNGVIQVTVQTPAQLNLCQNQCQQPFTSAAQQVTGRLVAVSFHCDNLPKSGGGVF